jgi:hypothetical protein
VIRRRKHPEKWSDADVAASFVQGYVGEALHEGQLLGAAAAVLFTPESTVPRRLVRAQVGEWAKYSVWLVGETPEWRTLDDIGSPDPARRVFAYVGRLTEHEARDEARGMLKTISADVGYAGLPAEARASLTYCVRRGAGRLFHLPAA